MEKEKRVELFIPKGHIGEEPNLLVGVNGMNYLLPRGKKSLVPQSVAYEVERARKAQNLLDQKVDALLGK